MDTDNINGIPTVKEIVREYLEQHGYDGLFTDDCSCELSDLAPCGEMTEDCSAGYKGPCTCGGGCRFHIWSRKPTAEELAELADAGKLGEE